MRIALVGLAITSGCFAEVESKTAVVPAAEPVAVASGGAAIATSSVYKPIACTVTATIDTGGAYDSGSDLTFDAAGRIVVAGRGGDVNPAHGTGLLAARFLADGTLDKTFGGAGYVLVDVGGTSTVTEGVAVDSAGRVLVVGAAYPNSKNETALVRLRPDGSRDATFGSNGLVRGPDGNPMDVMAIKSRVVVAGYTLAASFRDDGSLATTPSPTKPPILVMAAAAARDGGVVLAGRPWDGWSFAIARLDARGKVDTRFARGGIASFDFRSTNSLAQAVAVNADGRVIAAGSTDGVGSSQLAVCALTAGGAPDTSFGKAGLVVAGPGAAYGVAIDAAGGVAVVQNRPTQLVRLANDGSLVDRVDLPMGFVQAVRIARDGTIWATGETVDRHDLALVACR